jgi:hypothetical protein
MARMHRKKILVQRFSYNLVCRADTERVYLESVIRKDYDQCRVGETFNDLKQRAAFPARIRASIAIGWLSSENRVEASRQAEQV